MVVLLFMVVTMPVGEQAQANTGKMPASASGIPADCTHIEVMDEDAANVSATSPDGKFTVCIKEDRDDSQGRRYTNVYLSNGRRSWRIKRYKEIGSTGALEWSSDSSVFAWNWTSGGAVGAWNVDFFDVRSGHFRPVDKPMTRDFFDRFRRACRSTDTDVNEFFLKWVDNKSALMAIEASPGGLDCRLPHPTDVYLVSVPSGQIIRRLHGTERKTIGNEFSWLGSDSPTP